MIIRYVPGDGVPDVSDMLGDGKLSPEETILASPSFVYLSTRYASHLMASSYESTSFDSDSVKPR